MLIVTLGLAGSGNRRTRSPLGESYSVTPPSEAFFSTLGGGVWHRTEPERSRVNRNQSLSGGILLTVITHFCVRWFPCSMRDTTHDRLVRGHRREEGAA